MTLAQFDRLPESERDYWLADWQIAELECRDCGRPVSECADPMWSFYPFRRICYATMEREAADAAYAALHDQDSGAMFHDGTFTSWAAKRSPSHPYAATAGVTIGVADRDLAPWDRFTKDRDASPVASDDSLGDRKEADDAGERG